MGRRVRKGRPVNGILLLDKPKGDTSNRVLQRVKRLYNAQKAGHTGNLDPMATGVLPICFGEATKVSAFLLDADKAYIGSARLGQRTNTGDAEGEVIDTRPVPVLTENDVTQVFARFEGEISQIPPMHSAIKQNGQPLYKLAHQGLEVERKPRQVTIYELQLQAMEGDELRFFVRCSKGTYVRTLVEDIGEALGCGAYLSRLCRTQAGPFALEACHDIETIEQLAEAGDMAALDDLLAPVESALEGWPDVQLSENAAFYLGQGQAVMVPQAPTSGLVRLFDRGERFLGVGQIQDDGKVAPKRLFKAS